MIPSVASPEMAYMVLVALLLVARTSFDIIILHMTTSIERSIISRNRKQFQKHLLRFFLAILPVAAINSVLKYGQTEMHLRFRHRLTSYLYEKYLAGFVYYKISNLDTRLDNVDQLLTQDIERFSMSVTNLYSNITKPILDIVIYAYRLTGAIGFQGPSSMMTYLVASGAFLTWLRQPTTGFTIAEQTLEGKFRYMNARLITHSEEVAFYSGNEREKVAILSSFQNLIDLVRKSQQFRFSLAFIDNIVAKVRLKCLFNL